VTIQLSPPIPLWTPKGFAHAHVMIDPGIDHDLQWVCFIVATGECWTYLNKDIRLVDNQTMGRGQQGEVVPVGPQQGPLEGKALTGAPPRPAR
jgi:hypothetical protein